MVDKPNRDITNFAASSIDISNSITSLRGKNNINPDVGLASLVQIPIITALAFTLYLTSPFASVDIKPIAQIPFLGY